MSSSSISPAPSPVKEGSKKKVFLTLTLSTVGVSGVLLAFFLLFGNGDDRGAITALIILLADVYLIAGFFARQAWVKITSWLLTFYMFLTIMVFTWVPDSTEVLIRQGYKNIDNCYEYDLYSCYPDRVSLYDLLSGLSFGAWILASFGVIAALLTLAWPRIQGSRWIRNAYYATLAMFGVSGVLYAVSSVVDIFARSYDSINNTATAALVLAGTGLAIVVTFALVNSPKKTESLESPPAPALVESGPDERIVVDFKSPEAREAFYEFMKEYEYNKSSSFGTHPAEAEGDDDDEQKSES